MATNVESHLSGGVAGFAFGLATMAVLGLIFFYKPAAYRILPEGGICTLERGRLFHGPSVSWRQDEVLVRDGVTFLGGEPKLANARPPGDILAKCLEAPEEKWTWVVAKPKQK